MIRIENIENYTQEIINGTLILTPKHSKEISKEIYITEEELLKTNLSHSIILKCSIMNNKNNVNEIITNKTKFFSILIDIWKTIPIQKILQNTTFNMKLTNEKGLNGYKWNPELKLSIQCKDSNNTLKEIINMIKINNYSFDIKIKLSNERILLFKQ
jgi:hypothetical protein